MATNEEQVSRTQRVAGLAAIGVLGVATALAFGRVYVGHGPTWRLLAAALASLGVAAALRRQGLVVATLVSALCLLVTIGLIVFPTETWYGLPSGETLHAIRQALGRVGEQARVQVAPTQPVAPLMLAGFTAIWTAVFSAHTLAVRAGSPLLAVLPPIALVGFADTVLDDGARPGYALVFLVAVFLVVFADGLRRIRQWGPVWGATRNASSVAGRGAERVALVALAVAALAPGILPGFRSGALVDFSTTNQGALHLDPFVSIRAELSRKQPVELFQVTAIDRVGRAVPTYWRLYALDDFDGATWQSSDPQAEHGQILQTPARVSSVLRPNEPIVSQRYRITTDLPDRWLPMAYPPAAIVVPFGEVRYEPNLTAALAPESLDAGTEYLVTSRYVSPTAEQLDRVTFGPASEYGRLTSVPGNVSPLVGEIARRWVLGATSPYGEVLAIQQRFLNGSFRYSLDVRQDAGSDALLDFLTKTRTGFCQQFAATMAVMVRELGLPARVAVGFLPGTLAGTTFTVTTEEAHAWVEVLFPGYGWLPFDPTPGHSIPLATPGSYLNPQRPETCPSGRPGCATGPETSAGKSRMPVGPARKLLKEDRFAGRVTSPSGLGADASRDGYGALYRWLLIALLCLGGLLLVGIPAVKTTWRRMALRRRRPPAERVLATYRVFDGEAADLGLGRARGETLVEYRDRLSGSVRFSDGHLERLTESASRAAYGNQPATDVDAREALQSAKVAIRDMRHNVGTLRRVLGIYRPGV